MGEKNGSLSHQEESSLHKPEVIPVFITKILENIILMQDVCEPKQNHTGCPRRNGKNFGSVFLMLNYTDITQNTYIQS